MNAKDKQTLRKTAKTNLIQRRKNFNVEDKKICSSLLFVLGRCLQDFKKKNPCKMRILFYMPLPLEADIRPVLYKMRAFRGVQAFVPLMENISFKMVKFRLPVGLKKFGLKEPYNSHFNSENADIVVIPILGMDRNFKRVGYGKGMYDRFLERLKTKPLIIFISRELYYTSCSITNDYDAEANMVITREGIFVKAVSYARMDYFKFRRISHSCRGRCLSYFKKNALC